MNSNLLGMNNTMENQLLYKVLDLAHFPKFVQMTQHQILFLEESLNQDGNFSMVASSFKLVSYQS